MGELNFLLANQVLDPTRTPSAAAADQVFGAMEQTALAQQQARAQADKEARKAANARMEKAINNMASLEDIDKIPAAYRNQASQWLVGQRNTYYQASQMLGQYEANTPEYMQAVSIMNSVNDSIKTLDSQFKRLLNDKKEAMGDFDQRLISNGNLAGDVEWLSGLYTDKHEMQISPNGMMYFKRDDGFVSLDDAPNYFLRDSAAAKSRIDLNKSTYNSGAAMTDAGKEIIGQQVRQIVKKGGRETALSLATDDFIIEGGLGIQDTDLLYNVEREDELIDFVIKSYTDMIIESGVQGRAQKDKEANERASRRGSRGGSRGSGSGSGSGGGSGGGSTISSRDSFTEEELQKLTYENIPVLKTVIDNINSDSYNFFEGKKYNGSTIKVAAKGDGGGMKIQYGEDDNVTTINLEQPETLAKFINENFTALTGVTRNTKQGKQILLYINAWLHKKKYGNTGGYSMSVNTGNLPVNN